MPWESNVDFVLIPLAALVASGLTLFSGFGLGTLLTPIFALFMPVELAVAATAIVHAALAAGGPLSELARPRERWLTAAGALAAFTGVIAGSRFPGKVIMHSAQRITGGMLRLIAAPLGIGVI